MSGTESIQLLNEKNVKIVQQAVQAINNADAEGLLALFSDDIKFWMPGTTPVSCRIQGKPAFMEVFAQVAERLERMIVLEVTNVIPAGEWVVTEARGDSLTKNGEPYCNTYCHLWRVVDGKIAEFTEYNDSQLVMDVLFKD